MFSICSLECILLESKSISPTPPPPNKAGNGLLYQRHPLINFSERQGSYHWARLVKGPAGPGAVGNTRTRPVAAGRCCSHGAAQRGLRGTAGEEGGPASACAPVLSAGDRNASWGGGWGHQHRSRPCTYNSVLAIYPSGLVLT